MSPANSRRRPDSQALRVAERSNRLAFSPHHRTAVKQQSILFEMDVKAPARPRDKPAFKIMTVDKQSLAPTQQQVRSLVPPVPPNSPSAESQAGTMSVERRNRFSLPSSCDSTTLSLLKRPPYTTAPELAGMPTEMLESILQYVSQQGLLSLMLCSTSFIAIAAKYLYMEPEFASTYRFAQFTFTAINCPYYSELVRSLDISTFLDIKDESGKIAALAGWREFKYRHEYMFRVPGRSSSQHPQGYKSLSQQKAHGLPLSHTHETHPAPSPMMSDFERCRDVPIGGICHVLQHCYRIKRLNMSRLQLAADYVIDPQPSSNPANVQFPNYWISEPEQSKRTVTFFSDTPKLWRPDAQLRSIRADSIINLICQLRELESFTAKTALWLNTKRVRSLLEDQQWTSGKMVMLDFRESGMSNDLGWTIKARTDEIEKIVKAIPDKWEKRVS